MKNYRRSCSLVVIFIFLIMLIPNVKAYGDNLKSPIINNDGSVTFNYEGSGGDVKLAGSILDRDWKSRKVLKKNGDIYSITLKTSPGSYQYKFIVNGNWIKDPLNKDVSSNGNSVAYIPGFYDIAAPMQIKEDSTVNLYPVILDKEGNDAKGNPEDIKWSVKGQDVSIDSNGKLQVNSIPEGKDKLTITVLGTNNKNTVKKNIDIVKEITEVKGGRNVIITGTVQPLIEGADAWDPSCDAARMKYMGNGLYKFTFKNMPQGEYEYKIAMGSWDENYGVNGQSNGENIHITIKKAEDVTFYYSDVSHYTTDSTKYDETLLGRYFELNCGDKVYKLMDTKLNGIFTAQVDLKKGEYKNLKIKKDSEQIPVIPFTLDEDRKVNISYDMLTGLTFTDISNNKIKQDALYYNSRNIEYKNPYGAVKKNNKVKFSLKAEGNDISKVKLIMKTPDKTEIIDMKKAEDNFWTGDYTPEKAGIYNYYFIISNDSDVKSYCDDDGYFGEGKTSTLGEIIPYSMTVYYEDFKTPDWIKNAVVYQIFPDRFYDGDVTNDEASKSSRGNLKYEFYKDWYAVPEDPQIEGESGYKGTKGDMIWSNEIYGGDLYGIAQKLDYLKALGVNTLYINPISKSISNHRYDTSEYRVVDPLLGDISDFKNLALQARRRGMHIILDGVFNHVSDDSVYFDRYGKYIEKDKPLGAYQYWAEVYDIMKEKNIDKAEAEKETQKYFNNKGITDFHYKDWFDVSSTKRNGVYQYEGWWGYDSMPVIKSLDGSEDNIKSWRDEIIDGKESNVRYWLNEGSNGWRIDVANEVSDETWRNFRKAVKEEGDNAIIGEIWTDASKYLLGDMYDSVMNYRFRDAVLAYVYGKDANDNAVNSDDAVNMLEVIREQYPKEAFYSMLNLVGSHDTQRIISALDGYKKSERAVAGKSSEDAVKLAKLIPLIQMTYPGAPCIYYGDEAGMTGADDPDNRRAMIWGKGNEELVKWYSLIANIRNNYETLRTGSIDNFSGAGDVISFIRTYQAENAVIAINRGGSRSNYKIFTKDIIKDGTKVKDAITGREYTVNNGMVVVDLKEKSGVILVTDYKKITLDISQLKQAYSSKYIFNKDNTLSTINKKKKTAESKLNIIMIIILSLGCAGIAMYKRE